MEVTVARTALSNRHSRSYVMVQEQNIASLVSLLPQEFLFVGTNSISVGSLLEWFDAGYAADTVEHALNLLKKMASQPTTVLTVVVVSSQTPLPHLKELAGYLRLTEKFSRVPVIMDLALPGKNTNGLNNLRQLIDDAVDCRKLNKTFNRRVSFLTRVKTFYPAKMAGLTP